MPFILRLIIFVSSAIRWYICRPLIYNALCTKKMVDGILNRYIFTVFSYRFAILHRISVCLFIWFYNGLFFYKVYVSQSTLSSQSISKLKKKDTSSPKLLLAYWDPCDIGGDLLNVEYSFLSEGRLVFLTNESLGESVLFCTRCQQPGLQHDVSWSRGSAWIPESYCSHRALLGDYMQANATSLSNSTQITSKPFSNVSSPWGWKAVSFDSLSSSIDDTDFSV